MGEDTRAQVEATKAEKDAFVRAQQVAFDASQRAPSFVLAGAALMLAVPFLLLIPGAEEFLHTEFTSTLTVMVIAAGTVISASLAYYRFGQSSFVYRVLDGIETSVVVGGIGFVIARSGKGDHFFWFFYLVQILAATPLPKLRWHHVAPMLAMPLVVSGWFVYSGGLNSNALLPLLAVVTGSMMLSYGAGIQKRIMDLTFARERLSQQVSDLRVDAERVRIARDLHDGVTADLTAIAWRADQLARGEAAELAENLSKISDRARAAIDDTRTVVWALRNEGVDWNDLVEHVQSRARELCSGRAELVLETKNAESVRLHGEAAVDVIRVVQEAVRNALRHGSPRTVTISMEAAEHFSVQISDDGSGIGDKALDASGGVLNIADRVTKYGGTVDFLELDPGTLVSIHLPRNEATVCGVDVSRVR